MEANNLSVEPVTGSERYLRESLGRARRRGERGLIHHLSGPVIHLPGGAPNILPFEFFSQHFPMQSWRHFLAGFILVLRSKIGPMPK